MVLEFNPKHPEIESLVLFREKKAAMRDWLKNYLGSLTIEDVRGEEKRRHINSQITEGFNQFFANWRVLSTNNKLFFPNGEKLLTKVLFKEFAVQ